MKDFKKYYLINATPGDVFAALTNPFTIQLWTGEPAEMSTEPGSEFSMWGGSITGKNIDFIPGQMIRQEWYFGEQVAESIVTIKLHPHKNGTSAELLHTNIPDEEFDNFVEGWGESYFGALNDFFNL
jgi:uncharacterized protein YndB with AHSA1/START domain